MMPNHRRPEPAARVPRVLIVDDVERNLRLLGGLLRSQGYGTECAATGGQALEMARANPPDLILLDVLMPGLDGFEVCRLLRQDAALQATPVVLITSLDAQEDRIKGLDAGADEFLSKPYVKEELFARVRSLLRVKSYFDEGCRQREELQRWSATLEARVDEKIREIDRLAQLKRFFSPRLAAKLLDDGRDDLLRSHRCEVSVLFVDLRGFTAFAETQEADVVMAVLREFHRAMGELVFRFDGTLERFTGDGMMVFFNDPDPVPQHALQAVELGIAMCGQVAAMLPAWRARGGPAGVAVGVSKGIATVGAIGFEARLDYAAIGSVTNLAARLCSEARAGEVLVCDDAWADVLKGGRCWAAERAVLALKGFAQPVGCHRLQAADATSAPAAAGE